MTTPSQPIRPRRTRRRVLVVAAAVVLVLLAVTPVVLHSPPPAARGGHASAVQPTKEPNPPSARPKSKLNIVEVLADDMRVSDLKYTPELRRVVARNGIYMANSFSSYPLCCPARASFWSGLLPHNHHVYTVWTPYAYAAFDDRRTLATSLHDAGYTTGFAGKYLNGYGEMDALAPKLEWLSHHPGADPRKAPKVQSQYYVPAGWDDWKAGIQGPWCAPACGGEYHYFHYGYSDNGRPRAAPKGRYSSRVIGDQAVTMEKQFHQRREATGKPFFMSINYVAPHNGQGDHVATSGYFYLDHDPEGHLVRKHVATPVAPASAYRVPMIRNIARGAGVLADGSTEPDVGDKPGRWADRPELTSADDRAVAIETQRRAASVYEMDRNIGRLITQLKRDHEWRRTVFVFWSDNGYLLGEHHRLFGKILGYEPSLRVPMIITGPGMRGGSHTGTFGGQDRYDPIDVVDLTRTLLQVGHAATPHLPDGRSRLAVLKGHDEGWTTAVPYESALSNPARAGDHHRSAAFLRTRDGIADPRTSVGVRTGRYAYLRYVDGESEIYDLWKDPREWHNLAADPRWVRRHSALRAQLATTWRTLYACAGPSVCDPRLPADLSVGAAENERHTLRWQDEQQRAYGTWR